MRSLHKRLAQCCGKLWRVHTKADNYNAAVSAIKELNQLAGLSINRSQNININANLEKMSREQIKERLGQLLGAETQTTLQKINK